MKKHTMLSVVVLMAVLTALSGCAGGPADTAPVTPAPGAEQPVEVTVPEPETPVPEEAPQGPIRSAGEIGAYIDSLVTRGAYTGTQTNPVPLPLAFDLGKGSWASLLDAIAAAGKFVALDLSACAITDMSATAGEFDPDNTKATGKDKIVSLVLPDAATRIKGGTFNDPTFKGFSSLTRFSAGNIVSIGNYAFSGCSSLTAVSLPAGLTSIGNGAFQNCGGLTTISLPASLTSIGSAFAGCRNLSAIQVDQANRVYADRDGVLFNKAFTELIQYPAGKAGTSYAVPEGVTSIGNSAFYGCSSLRTISLPEGLTSIGQFAFYGCRSLTTVSLPAGLTSIGQSAFSGCSSLTSITLPVSLTSIGDFAFIGCSSLTTVSLPASLTSIGSYAFSGCISLSSITVASPQPPRLNGSLGISGSTIIYFPSASLDTYKNAEGWKNHADRIQAADQTSPGAQAMPVQPPVVVPPPPPPPPEPEPVP